MTMPASTRLWTRCSCLLLLLATIGCVQAQAPGHFFFDWPTSTTQCGTINLTWQNATPPFTAFIIPTWDQPFIYNIPDSAYSNGAGVYRIQLQLPQGTYYTMFMSDGRGFGSGGSAEIQIIGASNRTACLNTAASNQSTYDFSFSVAGQAKQCMSGLDLSWTGGTDGQPYNFSVIPLDQSFFPYDVPLDNTNSYESNWVVNMTTGTRFTIMMNSKKGYGRGGVAGVYQVANSSNTACVTQTVQSTGIWPNGLATNTLPVPTGPVTSTAGSSGLSGGAIAGIVIGVLALLAIIALMVWFLLRRKRRREAEEKKLNRASGVYPIDMGPEPEGEEGEGDNSMGMVEPYQQLGPGRDRDTVGGAAGVRAGLLEEHSGSEGSSPGVHQSPHGYGLTPDSGTGMSTARSSAGFAGLGAGLATGGEGEGQDWELHDIEGRTGPGVAGPLPAKISPHAAIPMLSSPLSSQGQSPAQGHGQMRITNPSDPSGLPALPPGAGLSNHRGGRRSDNDLHDPFAINPNRTFRRHEDAGRVRLPGQGREEVVDLPPLYTDIRRDEDEPR